MEPGNEATLLCFSGFLLTGWSGLRAVSNELYILTYYGIHHAVFQSLYMFIQCSSPLCLLQDSYLTPLLVCCFAGETTFEAASLLITKGASVNGSSMVCVCVRVVRTSLATPLQQVTLFYGMFISLAYVYTKSSIPYCRCSCWQSAVTKG